MAISGVTFRSDPANFASICVVDTFTDDLKELIKSSLSKICHGSAKSARPAKLYSYGNTVREFMKRFKTKNETTQIGMLGELLCHTLIFHFNSDLTAASPNFNMEEANIKKGFDVLIINKKNHKNWWITEVKAGELGKKSKDEKLGILINLAKNDLANRLSEPNETIWHNAINNVIVALQGKKKALNYIQEQLEEFAVAECGDGEVTAEMQVILCPVLFADSRDPVSLKDVSAKRNLIEDEDIFAEIGIFAVQKTTLLKLQSFLESEASKP